MKSWCTFFVALAFVLTFGSCTDHQVPEESRWRVKSLSRVLPDKPGIKYISQFTYDPAGKIAAIFTYQTPDSINSPTEKSVYFYDNAGRLFQMERTLSSSGSERYAYHYDQWENVSSINYTAAPKDYYDMTFSYDGSGKLMTSKRTFSFFSDLSFEQLNTYSFSNDSLSAVNSKTTLMKGVTPQSSEVNSILAYDGHKNPFFGNHIIPAPGGLASPTTTGIFGYYTYYGGIDNLLHLSKNNLVLSLVKGFSQID